MPLRFSIAVGHHLAIWATAVSVLCLTSNRIVTADEPAIQSIEQWSDVFGRQEVKLPIRFNGSVADGQRVAWSAAVENRVIMRREETLRANGGNPPQITIAFQLPDEEPKVVVSVVVTVDAGTRRLTKPLWIFPRDPFADNRPFPNGTRLAVFDPPGGTSGRLAAANLKFDTIRNLDMLPKELPEVLVVGEGVNFREHRALAKLLVDSAANGCRILCLAPADGNFGVLQPRFGVRGAPDYLHLRTSNVIADFDKRLDYLAWPGEGGVVRSSLVIQGKGGALTADVAADDAGWPWLDIGFAGGGRLVVCGFALISRWDDGPAPRHILRHVLSYAQKSPTPVPATGNSP
jgi:hypothetical protein